MGVSIRVVTVLSTVVVAAFGSVSPAQSAAHRNLPPSSLAGAQHDTDWPAYNGGLDGDHYSALAQIDRTNVSRLKVAWQFDTGEKGNIETNPLIVGRVLYACTPSGKIIALDAATGRSLWTFDSTIDNRDRTIGGASQPSRGLAYWTDGKSARLFAGVMNYLYAIDPTSGKAVPDFGDGGHIDLRKGLRDDVGGDYAQQSIALTTPGVIYQDLIIVGGRNPETHPAPPGDIRAYDVRTGALRWTFHTIPHPGEFGYNTWPPDAWKDAGAANNWAGMTLDAKRGILYVPTGSAVSISTVATASATICLRTRCWLSTPQPASASGISRACITTSGTVTFLRRPRW